MLHTPTNKLSLQSSNERSGSSEHLSNAETWSSHERILCKSNLPTSTLELEQPHEIHLMQQFLRRILNFSQQFNLQITTSRLFLATHTFAIPQDFPLFYSVIKATNICQKFQSPYYEIGQMVYAWIFALFTNGLKTLWKEIIGIKVRIRGRDILELVVLYGLLHDT